MADFNISTDDPALRYVINYVVISNITGSAYLIQSSLKRENVCNRHIS